MSENISESETPEEKKRRLEEDAVKFRKQRGLLERPEIASYKTKEFLSGGKSLMDEEKQQLEESQRQLKNFRLTLIDEDKLGPVE